MNELTEPNMCLRITEVRRRLSWSYNGEKVFPENWICVFVFVIYG